jgi:tol-pal system protein YbgF
MVEATQGIFDRFGGVFDMTNRVLTGHCPGRNQVASRLISGLAFAVALSVSATSANAQLFGFGRNQSVDPATIQVLNDRIQLLEEEVYALSAQIADLNAQLRQLQEFLHAPGVPGSPPVASLSLPPAGQGATAVPPAAPTTVRPTSPGVTTVLTLPPGNIGQPGTPLPGAATPGTGARLGVPETPPGSAPLDLSAAARGGAPNAPPATPPVVAAPPGAAAAATAPAKPATPPVQTAALPPVAPLTPSGDAKADYDKSYSFITTGRYDVAEGYFRTFLTAYPTSSLSGDAQYWLGQSLFQRAKYSEAAVVFREGYKLYPKSERAPDTLLALGQSLAGMGQRDEACQIYAAALKQHPTMAAPLKQRVITEQASAACSAG